MDIEHYLTTRPFAYHTTAAPNLTHLRATRAIDSTARLFDRAGRQGDPMLCQRRAKSITLQVTGREIVIRDQYPLAEGAIALEGGWTFGDLVRHLNGLVFLWPGDHRGPSGKYGRNHFARYEAEREALAVLRIPTRALLEANPTRPPRFSRYNSGATRCQPAFQTTNGKVFHPARFSCRSERHDDSERNDGSNAVTLIPPRS